MPKRLKKPEVIVPPVEDFTLLDPITSGPPLGEVQPVAHPALAIAAHPCPICGGKFDSARCPIDGYSPKDTP